MKRPTVKALILKIASRCNINCSYCYMYNLADRTFSDQPRAMNTETVRGTFRWIEQHVKKRKLRSFHVTLHGGEPLLAGPELIRLVAAERDAIMTRTSCAISVSLLTNGLLLSAEWIALLSTLGIRFGISIDGPAAYHNRFRLTHSGEGTHSVVEEWIKRILKTPAWRSTFSSVLCVLHPDMDGARLIRYFYELGVPGLDLLLPDQNHVVTSAHYPRPTTTANYGRILADAYMEWRAIDDPSFHVRKFGLFIQASLGAIPALDSVGLGPISVFTVETSGEVEAVDSLKACGNGFTKTGLAIGGATSRDIEQSPLIATGLRKSQCVDSTCSGCRNAALCGGGYLPHRFDGNGFGTRTVYCGDMMLLCDVIRVDVWLQLAASNPMCTVHEEYCDLVSQYRALSKMVDASELHSGRTLLQHLFATAALMTRLDPPAFVVRAALFHAVYGTRTFMRSTRPERGTVVDAIGRDAEDLVYAYANPNGEAITLSQSQAMWLQALRAVNALEQGHVYEDRKVRVHTLADAQFAFQRKKMRARRASSTSWRAT